LGFLMAAAIITFFPTGSFEEHIGTPTIDLGGAVFTTVLLGIVALVSGYFPAKRAANLEPVKALKLF